MRKDRPEVTIPKPFMDAAAKALQAEPTWDHPMIEIKGLPVLVRSVALALYLEHLKTHLMRNLEGI